MAFLQTQASLEELMIREDDIGVEGWASKLSRSDLPNLRSVTAAYGSLWYLIPGRAIREANPSTYRSRKASCEAVRAFTHNTCPGAARNGVEVSIWDRS